MVPEPLLVLGHALAGKKDLPIDDVVFVYGASLVLIVSFVALSLAWHRTKFEDDGWRPAPEALSRMLVNPVTEAICGLIGIFLLGVVVWSGLTGTEAPDRNFSLTFVFYTFWFGLAFVSVFAGDVFRAFNPWRAVARTVGGLFKLVAGQSAPPPLRYPERLGRWPAAVGLVAFVWMELVYGASGFGVLPGITPESTAVATLVYTAYTFVGMTLFGGEKWLERGETFSVYFGMFASLSPLEVRDGTLGVRRALSGASRWVAAAPGSVAVILLTIGATTFDGASEGALSDLIENINEGVVDIGLGPVAALRVTFTITLAITLAFIAGLFWAGIAGMHTVRTSLSTGRLGALFGHAFIPIALAYLVAHYFSALLYQAQAQFTFLLSDPRGDGSDLFGTADSGIDYGILSANTVWYVQVAALVIGHAPSPRLASSCSRRRTSNGPSSEPA
jgi:hypothetical protein